MVRNLPVERVVIGLALASIGPPSALVLAFTLWSAMMSIGSGGSGSGMIGVGLVTIIFGTMIAGLHATMLGLPLFLVLARWISLRWWMAAGGGFLVGAAPWSIVAFSLDIASLLLGALGMIGGLLFWTAVRTPLAEREEADRWPRIFASE